MAFHDPQLEHRFDLVNAEFALIETGRSLEQECHASGTPFNAFLFLAAYLAGFDAGAGESVSEKLIEEGVSSRIVGALQPGECRDG